jgi:hypothetical protein
MPFPASFYHPEPVMGISGIQYLTILCRAVNNQAKGKTWLTDICVILPDYAPEGT